MGRIEQQELKIRSVVNHKIISEKISHILFEISDYCARKLVKCKSCETEKYKCLLCLEKSIGCMVILENIIQIKTIEFLEYIKYPDSVINLMEYFMLMNDLKKMVDFYIKNFIIDEDPETEKEYNFKNNYQMYINYILRDTKIYALLEEALDNLKIGKKEVKREAYLDCTKYIESIHSKILKEMKKNDNK